MAEFDFKESAARTMGFIKRVESEIGPRLPGSDEERAAAVLIGDEFAAKIGKKPVSEHFKVAPESGIGAIPYVGIGGMLALAVFLMYPVAGAAIALLCLLYFLVMGGFYTQVFDFLWKKRDTQNFYSVLEPSSGKADYTIYLTAHYDSSWNWILAKKNPKTFIPKIVWGVAGILAVIAFGFAFQFADNGAWAHPLWTTAAKIADWPWYVYVGYILPAACLPGIYFITQFLSHDKTQASPGCMDNLTGIGINMEVAKHFAENPDDLPGNCRLICAAMACEESGLRGSRAFVKLHAKDGMLENAYQINVDSISDEDYFEVVQGDLVQMCPFDRELGDMLHGILKDMGLVKKTGRIWNPVGGCDSTPFKRAGVRTITFAAQNPVATDYYHTSNDKSGRLKVSVLEGGTEAVYRLVKMICEKESAKAAEPVNAPATEPETTTAAEPGTEIGTAPETETAAQTGEKSE